MSPTQHAASDVTEHACRRCGAMCSVERQLCARCSATEETQLGEGELDFESELLDPGTMIDVYRVERLLGEGGVGIVYEATHTTLGRRVAVKVLRPEFSQTRGVVRRFFAEARAANRIAHENIVEVTDFREHPDIGAYLIMELLDGRDLGEELNAVGALEVERAIRIGIQTASALGAAHDAGIVHRDMKPDNVFLCVGKGGEARGEPDFVKVLDFGIAKLGQTTGEADVYRTAAGTLLGTPAYMSPEQGLGQPVDHRTDIYSFGVILFELLTCALPFEAETAGEFILMHATTEPRRVRELRPEAPRALDALVARCMAKEQGDRPASMREVQAELEAIAALPPGADLPSREPTERTLPAVAPDPVPPPPRSNGGLVIAAAIGLVLLGVAAFVIGSFGGEGDTPVARPAPEPPVVAAPEPPPPEPPPPPAIPAPPETVSVSFRSNPAGAEIWHDGADAPLGVTPLSTTLPRGEAAAFELRLDGYEPHREELALDADVRASVTLRRARPTRRGVRPPVEAPSPRGTGRRGVLSF